MKTINLLVVDDDKDLVVTMKKLFILIRNY